MGRAGCGESSRRSPTPTDAGALGVRGVTVRFVTRLSERYLTLVAACVVMGSIAMPSSGVTMTAPAASDIVAVSPARLLDTRADQPTIDGQFSGVGIINEGETLRVQIAGRSNVPADASGAELNLAAINPSASGYATLFPCTDEPPLASTLNYSPGRATANASLTKLDASGGTCIHASQSAHFALDVVAYTPQESDIVLIEPVRLLDTRPNGETIDSASEATGPVTPGSTLRISIAGRAGIPSDSSSVEVNLAAINAAASGYATLHGCEAEPPLASTINFTPDANISNATMVGLSPDGELCITASTTVDFALDAVAFALPGSDLTTITPARLADSRKNGQTIDGGGPRHGLPLEAGSTRMVGFAGRGGVPLSTRVGRHVTALELNLAIVNPTGRGYATLYPCDDEPPITSTVNYVPGLTVANSTIMKVRPFGSICVYTSAETHFVVDVTGYATSDAVGRDSPVWFHPTDEYFASDNAFIAPYLHSADGSLAVVRETIVGPEAGSGSISVVETSDRRTLHTRSFGVDSLLARLSPDGTEVLYADRLTSDEEYDYDYRIWTAATGDVRTIGADPCSHNLGPAWDGLYSLILPPTSEATMLCVFASNDLTEIEDSREAAVALSRSGQFVARQNGTRITVTDLADDIVLTDIDAAAWSLRIGNFGLVSDNGDLLLRNYERAGFPGPLPAGVLRAGAVSINEIVTVVTAHSSAMSLSEDGSAVYTWRQFESTVDGQLGIGIVVDKIDEFGQTEVGRVELWRLYDYGGYRDDLCLGNFETAGNSFRIGSYNCLF